MKAINPELVQHFVSCSKASPKTTRNITVTLQAMFATARAWGYVTHDPMTGVVLPDIPTQKRFHASQEQ
jgi:hypothetical protein